MRNSRYSFRPQKLPVSIQPNIGLDSEVRQSVVDILNKFIASETELVLSTEIVLRNVGADDFAEFYSILVSQSKLMNVITGELAERIAILDGVTMNTQFTGKNDSLVEEESGVTTFGILRLIDEHETFIRLLREDARKCTEELEDEGTFELLIDVMRSHEKMAWMLRSYIRKEPLEGES